MGTAEVVILVNRHIRAGSVAQIAESSPLDGPAMPGGAAVTYRTLAAAQRYTARTQRSARPRPAATAHRLSPPHPLAWAASGDRLTAVFRAACSIDGFAQWLGRGFICSCLACAAVDCCVLRISTNYLGLHALRGLENLSGTA